MSAQFTIQITTEPSALPTGTGMQASGLILSLIPDKPDIPVTIRAYGNSGTTLGQQQQGSKLLATGQLKIVQNGDNKEPIFIINSFPAVANMITIVGRLGKDPDLRYFESGKVVCKGSIAVTEGKNDPPSWFGYEAWGKDAELMGNYCRKGKQLALSGSIALESWTDPSTGAQRSKLVLKVSKITFCGSKNDDQAQAQSTDSYSPPPTAYRSSQELAGKAPAPQTQQPQGGDWNDIPF
jgi:single-strand DNA-binding protein